MSIAKVEYVAHAAKDQGRCEKDGTLLPKGGPYRWYTVGYRSKVRHKRCMNPQCTPARSELESSLLAEVWAGQESAEAALHGLGAAPGDDPASVMDDAQQALQNLVDALDSVASMYREQDEHFGGGGSTDSAERADNLEAARDELADWQADSDSPEECEEHGDGWVDDCDECTQAWRDWGDSVIDSAQDAIDSALSNV